jgi:hypothetical protein
VSLDVVSGCEAVSDPGSISLEGASLFEDESAEDESSKDKSAENKPGAADAGSVEHRQISSPQSEQGMNSHLIKA